MRDPPVIAVVDDEPQRCSALSRLLRARGLVYGELQAAAKARAPEN